MLYTEIKGTAHARKGLRGAGLAETWDKAARGSHSRHATASSSFLPPRTELASPAAQAGIRHFAKVPPGNQSPLLPECILLADCTAGQGQGLRSAFKGQHVLCRLR